MRRFWIDGQQYDVRLPSAEEANRCFAGIARAVGEVPIIFSPLKQDGAAVWLGSEEYAEFGLCARTTNGQVLMIEETSEIRAFCCLVLVPMEASLLEGVEEFAPFAFGSVQRCGKEMGLSQGDTAAGAIILGNTPANTALQLRVMKVGSVFFSVPVALCTFLEAKGLLEN